MRPRLLLAVLVLLAVYLGYEYIRFRRILAFADLPAIPAQARLSYGPSVEDTDPYTVVVLGDSTGQGIGAQSVDESFGAQVAQSLAKRGGRVELINLASSGAQAQEVLVDQAPRVRTLQPDLVLLSVGANDVTSWVAPPRYLDQMERITEMLEDSGAEVLVLNVPPIIAAPLLPLPVRWVFDVRTKQYNEGLEELAASRSWRLVTIYEDTRAPFEQDDANFSADRYHPSSQGYQLWAESVLRTPSPPPPRTEDEQRPGQNSLWEGRMTTETSSGRKWTVEDILSVKRLSDVQMAADGSRIAYAVRDGYRDETPDP
ncbi:MAG: SGNH/GDSL hydrolase family protein, partial [Chloroflexota bacterium]|nr:SGNH/GDSL hydrolase family protein [Chloroflexota bacterium]